MVTALEQGMSGEQSELLKPYVPRLLIEWMRSSPETHHHAVEGTLAFVDISGFTALTERLSRRGKIGSEELRDLLDGVFKALLDEAYEWGAGLLKWGGDALLLLFDGPGHPERAVRAMWELQRTIDRVGQIRVGGGKAVLRMSVGMATGSIEFFTAGSVHRELLIAGPTASETVQVEAIADAGDIALSPALAKLLDPSCLGREKRGARLLAHPPDAVRAEAPDVGSVVDLDIASCIPLAAREHVLLEHSEPEHRMITATFFELMDTDELLAELGPRSFSEALDARIRTIQQAAARYEVPFNVTDVSGGAIKVLLTAGAPSTTGHDEEQTLRLVREVMDEPGVIPMRAGINSGRVFTGDFGPPYRRTYAVLGDAINTAARVMSRAEPGQILATEPVLARSRTLFRTRPIEPFQAKGKAEPVRASLIGAVVGRQAERVDETPFVGRERELEALRMVVEDARAGNGWSVEITGPSGIGKTRLLRELFAATPDLRVLHSTCEEYESSTPYFALRDPMRSIVGIGRDATPAQAEQQLRKVVAVADADLVPWVPLLGVLLALDLEPTLETSSVDERFLREVLADITVRLLNAALGDRPVALVVEDAQFMDDASADLLHRLAGTAQPQPGVLVIARTRPEGLWTDMADDEQRHLVFDLLPLSERQAAEIVELATDETPMRPHEVDELARRSGGSPLFLVELLNVARSAGTTEALPDSIEAVVTADIDRLSPSDRIVLRYASVLGVTFEEGLLAATLHDDVTLDSSVWNRLKGLVDRDSSGLLRFRNTLVHDTAYEGLPFRRRRELHARVAEAIEAAASSLEDEAATLALHYSAAKRNAETWRYGRLGGDRARVIAANVEAARLYELALHAGRFVQSVTRRERADVLVALSAVRDTFGLFEESYGALARATPLLADDPVEQARLYTLRARARARTAAYTQALRETSRGLRLLEDRVDRPAVAARATLLGMRSEVCMYQGRARAAIRIALSAVEHAKEAEELEALAHAYTALDGSYQMLGQPEKAVHERMALELYRRLGNARLSGLFGLNVGVQAAAEGRWGEAVELYERAREDFLHAGDRAGAAHTDSSIAEILIGRGQLEEAERLLQNTRRVLRGSGYRPYALFAETQLARCVLDGGDIPRGAEQLERIADEAALVGYSGVALEASLYLVHGRALAGDTEAALATLDASVAAAGDEEAMYEAAIRRARAACLVAQGRTAEAREELDLALAASAAQGLRYERLLDLRAKAALPGEALSDEELRETESLAQLLDVPL